MYEACLASADDVEPGHNVPKAGRAGLIPGEVCTPGTEVMGDGMA